MLTQCPSCQTIFRVTSEILRVADGQVRCGRCQTQFDALERLMEETDSGEVQSGRSLRASPAAQPQPEEEEADLEQPITDEVLDGEELGDEDLDVQAQHLEPGAQPISPDASADDEWVEIDDLQARHDDESAAAEIEDSAEEAVPAQSEPDFDVEPAADEDVQPRGASGVAFEHAASETTTELDLLSHRRRPAVAAGWKILLAPLALLLIGQIVHHYSPTLARHPRVGPPLAGIYDALGLSLRPDWNLHAYEIQQWHVGSDPATPGTLKVRAHIRNTASFAQPYPLLKLALVDLWDEPVATREFEPADYLDPPHSSGRLMAPAQRASVTISIVDPGKEAAGFRFDVCLPGARGPVCAADVPRG